MHFAFCIGLFLVTTTFAQPETAPPPLKMVTKAERLQLEAKAGKERMKLAGEFMNARLAAAERSHHAKDFIGVFRELGVFHALIDDSLEYLERQDKAKTRTLDNFKRVEIVLRGFATRIEILRREMPLEYDDYLKTLLKHIRDSRTRASEPLFGDSVVPRT